MDVPGHEKRIQDFGVERRWTIVRIYKDRAKLFLKFSLIVGVAVTLAWLTMVETNAAGRANLPRYAWASWLAWQRVDTPLELTLDGTKLRGAPEAFERAMCARYYDGRGVLDLVAHALWAGGAGTLATFLALSYFAWRRRPIESDEEVLKGSALRDREQMQRAITTAKRR